jgi:hypothetical protein
VIAPANTGNVNNNNTAVMNIAHTNNGNLWRDIPFVLMFKAVLMKLIAPNNEETPAKCKLKIAKSTEPPECDWIPASGGYQILVNYNFSIKCMPPCALAERRQGNVKLKRGMLLCALAQDRTIPLFLTSKFLSLSHIN